MGRTFGRKCVMRTTSQDTLARLAGLLLFGSRSTYDLTAVLHPFENRHEHPLIRIADLSVSHHRIDFVVPLSRQHISRNRYLYFVSTQSLTP